MIMATTMQDILGAINPIKSELKTTFKVNRIGIFGSVVRGEEKKTSDIDFLVDLDQDADLLDLIGLAQFLEERLHRRCDVVPRNALRPELRDRILSEVQYA
jgi:predicted nucleotidyltransferase